MVTIKGVLGAIFTRPPQHAAYEPLESSPTSAKNNAAAGLPGLANRASTSKQTDIARPLQIAITQALQNGGGVLRFDPQYGPKCDAAQLNFSHIAKQLPNLTTLDLRDINRHSLANNHLEHLNQLKHLQFLALKTTALGFTDIALQHIPSTVTTLDLTLCGAAAEGWGLRGLKLQSLTISDSSQLTDAGLLAGLHASAASLESLSLRNCKDITGDGLEQFKNLETLDLSHCKKISTATLGKITESCNKLKAVIFEGCDLLLAQQT